MKKFAIDKGIPIQKLSKQRTPWPWADMEVGDSILIPSRLASKAATSAHAWGERSDPVRKFTSRQQPDNQHRIWRIQ